MARFEGLGKINYTKCECQEGDICQCHGIAYYHSKTCPKGY